MIRVHLPFHLRRLAGTGAEVALAVAPPVSLRAVLDALEAAHPALRGTVRDARSGQRRPFIRFFACGEDWSHAAPEAPLPAPIASGAEPLLIVGAVAGGSGASRQMQLWVTGRVQGVFFRASTVREARRLGLTGWVRNLPDGRVHLLAEGPPEALTALAAWAAHGPPDARVTHVQREDAPASGTFDDFGARW